jgi:hypothetical protein
MKDGVWKWMELDGIFRDEDETIQVKLKNFI